MTTFVKEKLLRLLSLTCSPGRPVYPLEKVSTPSLVP